MKEGTAQAVLIQFPMNWPFGFLLQQEVHHVFLQQEKNRLLVLAVRLNRLEAVDVFQNVVPTRLNDIHVEICKRGSLEMFNRVFSLHSSASESKVIATYIQAAVKRQREEIVEVLIEKYLRDDVSLISKSKSLYVAVKKHAWRIAELLHRTNPSPPLVLMNI